MEPSLILQSEMIKRVRSRLESRAWWIFLPVDKEGTEALSKIEKRFYWDEAGHDFDVAMTVNPWLAIAMGKKTRVSPERLCKFMRKMSTLAKDLTVADLKERDVIVLTADSDDVRGQMALRALSVMLARVYPEMN